MALYNYIFSQHTIQNIFAIIFVMKGIFQVIQIYNTFHKRNQPEKSQMDLKWISRSLDIPCFSLNALCKQNSIPTSPRPWDSLLPRGVPIHIV